MKEYKHVPTAYYHLIINKEEVLITSDVALLGAVLTSLQVREAPEKEVDCTQPDAAAHYVRWNADSAKLDKLTVKITANANLELALLSGIKTKVEKAMREGLDLNAIHWYLTKLEEEYRRT